MAKYTDPHSVVDTIVELAFAVLIVAVLLTLAVDLLERIWVWIVGFVVIAGAVFAGIRLWLYCRDRW